MHPAEVIARSVLQGIVSESVPSRELGNIIDNLGYFSTLRRCGLRSALLLCLCQHPVPECIAAIKVLLLEPDRIMIEGPPCDVDSHGADSRTSLVLCIKAGCLEVVKLLLEQDADPNKADCDGLSPLSYSVRQSDLTIISHLIQAKASGRDSAAPRDSASTPSPRLASPHRRAECSAAATVCPLRSSALPTHPARAPRVAVARHLPPHSRHARIAGVCRRRRRWTLTMRRARRR